MDELECPHCLTAIYRWFVERNHKCPACGKPLETNDCRELVPVRVKRG